MRYRGIFSLVAFVALYTGASNYSTASAIFQYVCGDGTCGGDSIWGGFFEVKQSALTSGTALGSNGDILAFSFQSSDLGGLSWDLSGLMTALNDLTLTFNASSDLIASIDGGALPGCLPTPCARFATGSQVIYTNASVVNDFGNQSINGIWQSIPVLEPATLALVGLGLSGIGYGRRKKLN